MFRRHHTPSCVLVHFFHEDCGYGKSKWSPNHRRCRHLVGCKGLRAILATRHLITRDLALGVLIRRELVLRHRVLGILASWHFVWRHGISWISCVGHLLRRMLIGGHLGFVEQLGGRFVLGVEYFGMLTSLCPPFSCQEEKCNNAERNCC